MANLVGDTTVSDNTSHASSTLSEFMARRVNGFPVFGGDVRTGATELYGATAASARGAEAVVRGQVSQLVQALQVVLRMAVVEYAVGMDVQPLVGDVNDACELAQGGQVQCQRALDNHLQDYVFVANGVKPSTREVLSTVVSALYGVAYHMQGERGTALVDEKFGLLRDAHAALDMSVLRVSDGLRDVPVGMSATSPPVERVDMDWHKRVNSILPGYGLIA